MNKNRRRKSTGTEAARPAAGGATDTRKLSTKERLIEVAERLLGQRGFDGISLREIASAAGQANSNVVQYHFNDKDGLIQAILEDRVLHIEQVRCMQLAMLDSSGESNPRQLLKVLWLPLMSIKDTNGTHSFCRFMLQYMLHPHLTNHPLAPFYSFPLGNGNSEESGEKTNFPCGKKAAQLLMASCANLPVSLFLQRISVLATMFLASVVEYDNTRASTDGEALPEFDIGPILDMAVAALLAPA